MKRILGIAAVVLSAGMMAGCENPANRIAFDGQYFRAKVAKLDKQRDVFVVSVRDVSRSPKGARQAAYHEAVTYCLANYGTSDISWQQDPLDEELPLQISDDSVSFQGRCPQAQKI